MRIKKLLKRLFLFLFLAVTGIVVVVIVFGIQSTPLVLQTESVSTQDMERIKQQWETHDPRKLRTGEIKNLVVPERDFNLFSFYGLSRLALDERLRVQVEFSPSTAYTRATAMLPFTLFGEYLNISVMLSQDANTLQIRELYIGAIKIPRWVSNFCINFAYRYVRDSEDLQGVSKLLDAVKDVRFQQSRMLLTYQWEEGIMDEIKAQGRDLIFSEEDKDRLGLYNEHLVDITDALPEQHVSLTDLLKPLFEMAQKRTSAGNEPEAENKTLLLLLALYVNGRDVADMLEPGMLLVYHRPRKVTVTLRQRDDLAKHFLISAAIVASADNTVANVLGVFKEIDDADGGSGFSFADLAADQAGVRFAEMAVNSSQQAQLLQQRIVKVQQETAFMPRIDQLPEGIMKLELQQQFGNLDTDAYRMVDNEIKQRIAACWIYQ